MHAVAEPAQEPFAAAAVASVAAGVAAAIAGIVARRSARNLAGDGFRHELAAGDRFFVGDADADRTGRLARHRLADVGGALDGLLLFDALPGADLDLLFNPDVLADGDLAGGRFAALDLLADGHGAFLVFGAMHPVLDGARAAGVAGVARVVAAAAAAAARAAAMAVAAEQPAAVAEQSRHFAAFPVAQTHERLLHAGFLDGFPGRLHDGAIFPASLLLADLTHLFLDDRHFLLDADDFLMAFRDAFDSTGVVRLRAALDLVGRPLGGVIFANPLRTSDGAERRARRPTATWRISPNGRNRYGGNGANQQCETKRLADHAFSLVVHADPVRPSDTPAWVRIDSPVKFFTSLICPISARWRKKGDQERWKSH